jgi:hypothetical protein
MPLQALPVRLVVPGHGRPFDDVPAALERARSRLQGLRSDPARHARHALKVLVKYHVMEEREQALDTLLDWAESTPLLRGLWLRHPPARRGQRARLGADVRCRNWSTAARWRWSTAPAWSTAEQGAPRASRARPGPCTCFGLRSHRFAI